MMSSHHTVTDHPHVQSLHERILLAIDGDGAARCYYPRMPTGLRYILLQIPGLTLLLVLLAWAAANQWISPAVALAVFAAWVVKDAALYPIAKRVLQQPLPPTGTAALLGRETEATQALAPRGLVRVGNERWLARTRRNEHIGAGSRVRVVGADGLVLVVEEVRRATQH
jgi:membrane protein implicated in regulation of membrane protease activity